MGAKLGDFVFIRGKTIKFSLSTMVYRRCEAHQERIGSEIAIQEAIKVARKELC